MLTTEEGSALLANSSRPHNEPRKERIQRSFGPTAKESHRLDLELVQPIPAGNDAEDDKEADCEHFITTTNNNEEIRRRLTFTKLTFIVMTLLLSLIYVATTTVIGPQQESMKVILLTGATDGIGLATAKVLVAHGHHLLVHGRNATKLQAVQDELSKLIPNTKDGAPGKVETYKADLLDLKQVETLAKDILAKYDSIDVLMNNAGVAKAHVEAVDLGKDIYVDERFVVNTIAPYLLTKRLMPALLATPPKSPMETRRIINVVSSNALTVDLSSLTGGVVGGNEPKNLSQVEAYGESKLGLLQWTFALAADLAEASRESPESNIIAVALHPGHLIDTKNVRESIGFYGGQDVSVGANILVEAATSKKFGRKRASGKFFNNDRGRFVHPHQDAMNPLKNAAVRDALDELLAYLGHGD